MGWCVLFTYAVPVENCPAPTVTAHLSPGGLVAQMRTLNPHTPLFSAVTEGPFFFKKALASPNTTLTILLSSETRLPGPERWSGRVEVGRLDDGQGQSRDRPFVVFQGRMSPPRMLAVVGVIVILDGPDLPRRAIPGGCYLSGRFGRLCRLGRRRTGVNGLAEGACVRERSEDNRLSGSPRGCRTSIVWQCSSRSAITSRSLGRCRRQIQTRTTAAITGTATPRQIATIRSRPGQR